jgi:hypothetical protein
VEALAAPDATSEVVSDGDEVVEICTLGGVPHVLFDLLRT